MDFQHEKYENPVLLLTGRQDISVGYQNIIEIIEEYPRGNISSVRYGRA